MASAGRDPIIRMGAIALRRRTLILWLLPLAPAAATSIWVVSDVRRWSEESIRERLLKAAPLGSSIAQVEAVVKRSGWPHQLHTRSGFYDQRVRPARDVGVQHIRANLGDYRNIPIPLPTNVTVFWGFDGDGRLIDIWVWKTTDGP